ncbi:outer membrane lipoprotein chaperone LolA [Dokdonella sp.]|uniref:outer membrane lipoprotein chaperone LolA n=1 Tax=Dokdonella sp. TaxID=2291710 RepID=UPI0025C3A0D1|nr:outer membrane lipoprotein chaperone LolA [Dokdonella sp.]MBX3692573.1 outer membrane lipoprotein chaperone LolA [Dokdonella sp.]MCW5568405.1 outer membrane lipoprotein chaperone LolA [Dokdonella sp.]
MLRLLVLLALLLPLSANADDARVRMQSFAQDLHSLSGAFEQSVTGARGSRGEPSRGTLALKAPRQFRWQTTAPFEQTIVADGARVWVYDPDLMQASVRSQSAEEAQSPLTVLTDLSRLDADFTASEAGEREGFAWLRLVPKADEAEFAFAELGFDHDGALARMRFEDALGNTTEIRFSGWQRNPKLPDDTFRFTPPPGVDVVGDPGKDAEVIPLLD